MFRKMVYLMAVLSMVLSIAPASAASSLYQGKGSQPALTIPTVKPPQQGSTREAGSLPIGPAKPNKTSHRASPESQSEAATRGPAAPAMQAKAPAAPPRLVSLKPGSDARHFGGYLAWLRFNGRIEDFKRVEGSDAFLVYGEKGLGLVAAQSEVANLAPATAEKIAAVQADSQRQARPELKLPARPNGIQAYTPTTPTIQVYIYAYYVSGTAITGTVSVTVTKGVGGAQYFGSETLGSPGGYNIYFWSMPYPHIEPGDTVQVYEPGGSGLITLVVPDLRLNIDRAADAVSGKAPVAINSTDPLTPPTLYVSAYNLLNRDNGNYEFSDKYLTTDGTGNFTTVFTYTNPTTGTYDIQGWEGYFYVSYVDANGNYFYQNDSQDTPALGVELNTDYADGATRPRAPYTVTLKNSAGVVKGQFTGIADTDGDFEGDFQDVYGNRVASAAGDTASLSGAYAIDVPVVNLTAIADPIADTVTGLAPVVNSTSPITLPNLGVWVDYGSPITNPTGAYLVYSNTVGDFDPGDSGGVWYWNSNTDDVYMNFAAPVLAARGYYYDSYRADNFVSGYAPLSNVAVSIALKRAGATVGTAMYTTASNGWFEAYINDLYGNAANIQANDTLEASTGGSVFATLVVPAFDVTSDAANDRVTGTTSATVVTTTPDLLQTLAVWPTYSYDYNYGKYVTVTASAFTATNPFYWYADPMNGPVTLDWYPGGQGHYRYINSAGYQVYGQFTAPYNLTPMLSLRWDQNQYNGCSECYPHAVRDSAVSGTTREPYASVSIVLKRGGTLVGWATTMSDYNGEYVVQLRDALNMPAIILDGDTVEATANGVTTSATAPAMTANANYDTGILTGTVVPTGSLQANYFYYDSYWGYYHWSAVDITPTVGGAYSVTLPDLTNSFPQGYLNYADANGNHVYKAWTATGAPGAGPQVMLRGAGGWYANNYVYVYASANGVLTVTRGATTLTMWNFRSWGDSTYLYDTDDNPVGLQAGDVVQATAGGATTVITVPTVSVTSDPVLDRLTGTTNADVITTTYGATRTLALWPTSTSYWDYGKYVQPASGAFTATNPFYEYADPLNGWTTLNWNAGAQGHYRYVDAADNRVYGRFIAPYTPKLWIEENGNYLGGYVATPGVLVTVTLKNSTGAVKATRYTTSDRLDAYFWADLYDAVGNPVYILANDVVEVSASPTITVPVVPLSAQVNATTNVVSGSGPANAGLSVEVNGYSLPAITNASGAFSVDFTGVRDILPGDYVRIRYINANGHEIYLSMSAPQLRVNKGNNYVEGYVARPNTPVVGTLKNSGGAIRATATMTSSWYGGFYYFYFVTATGVPAIIATGDVVEVVSSGAAMSLTVPTLTASVNPAADTVTGQAPGAGALINVELYNAWNNWQDQKTATADGSGNYAAGNPWDTSSYDVLAGWRAFVTYTNADGNEVYLNATAPVVYVRGDANGYTDKNRVTGYVTPFAVANVALKRGGSTVASALYSTGSDGWFGVYLYDVTGASASILDGDQVVVTGSAMTVTVPTINATAYAVTNTLQGTISPAGSRLKVVDIWRTGCAKSVTSDGTTGAFSATNPFYDLDGNSCNVTFYSGDVVDTHYVDASGNWVYQRFIVVGDATTGAPKIYARWGDDAGVNPNYVSGYATVSNATVNLTLKRGGTAVGFATTTSWGNRGFSAALLGASGQAVSIVTGDVIELTGGGVTTTFTVPELTAAYNNASGVLYGKGPANSPLYCSDCWPSITTGPDGAYAVGAYSSGYVYYTDTNGNRVYTGWSQPYVWVRENGDEVEGRVGTFNSPVTVTLKSGGSVKAIATTTSNSGAWFDVSLRDAVGNPAVIMAGDTVEVSASPTVVIPVVPLSLNVNLAADQLTGTGPANALLDTYAGPNGMWRNPTVDATGAYTADYAGYYDIQPGDGVETDYWNDAGSYGIWLSYNAPLVRVNATANIVDGYTTPNKAVSLALKRGGSTLATASTTSDVDGFFSAFFTAAGSVVDILAGDIVDVTASPTNSITVPTLTANLNAATNVVSGTAPAGSTVRVWAFHWDDGWFDAYDKSVNTDSSGNYSADFTTDVDLLDYDYAYVRYIDSNGNQSAVNTTPAISPWKTQAEQSVTGYGAALKTSTFGVANGGDLSTPMFYTHSGGKAVFASRNGSLYLTGPDGAVYDTSSTFFTINNAAPGVYTVQVWMWEWDEEGIQYAMAAGLAALAPDLSASTKTVDKPKVNQGSIVTYTITLANTGKEVANATVTDPLPTGASYVLGSATLNAAAVGLYNDTVNRIEWSGQVPSGVTTTISFRAVITATGGTVVTNTVTINDGAGTVLTRQAATQSIRYMVYLPIIRR